jgi:magnesium and cobalt transporter
MGAAWARHRPPRPGRAARAGGRASPVRRNLGVEDCVASPGTCQASVYSPPIPTADTVAVSDAHPARSARQGSPGAVAEKRSLFERIVEFIGHGPDSKDELIRTLADAENRELIEPESRLMLEGVLRMADMTAGDVMVAAPRMDLLAIDWPYEQLLAQVIETAHSRFPVYDGARDNVIGILMAKDLLKLQRAPELNLRTLLRPAVFVPESKRLNELLRDFRSNRNHLAIVIDEFGNTAGLITIEDVLEEIVGEIEDEFDDQDAVSGIVTLADGTHRVAGDTHIADVNATFGTALPEADFDTIGGLVAHEFGRVPRRGEQVDCGPLQFQVMLTRGGAVRWFRVDRRAGGDTLSEGDGG